MVIKAYSNKELAKMYGVSYRTWLTWVAKYREKNKSFGKPIRDLYQPKQVLELISHLGLPSKEINDV
jgi:transposase